jgi:hypothetical protein
MSIVKHSHAFQLEKKYYQPCVQFNPINFVNLKPCQNPVVKKDAQLRLIFGYI